MIQLNSSLFLAADISKIIIPIVAGIVCLVAGFFIGGLLYKRSSEKKLGSIDQQIENRKSKAEAECKQLKKEAILEAQEQDLKLRKEFEAESREKKAELQKYENRLSQKEDVLDKKEDSLNKKLEAIEQQRSNLQKQESEVKRLQEKINHQHELMIQELEKVAQLTKEEAKQILTNEILTETRNDVAVQVRNIEQAAKEDAELNAKNIISLAIQRCAADQASEITVSTVALPNDDMKARIIGREGET